MGTFHRTTLDVAKASGHGQKRKQGDSLGSDAQKNPSLFYFPQNGDFHRPSHSLNSSSASALVAGEIFDVSDRGVTDYSQRRHLALTPNPTSNPLLVLSHVAYGLSEQLVKNFASLGINSIYPWQSDCLLRSGALRGGNLVYCAPTGGGKSLVADVLMLKKVIDNPGQKAVLVLPYVALVQEKLRWLRKVVEGIKKPEPSNEGQQRPSLWQKRGDEDNLKVAGFFGGSKSGSVWADVDIAVCTIEKANSLVNTEIGEKEKGKLPIVVVMDELHMLDDENRGYILELMATKLLSIGQNVQLIGMSATLNNTEVLAVWLKAKYYVSNYRPVHIEEHLVFDNVVYAASSSASFYKTATQLNSSVEAPATGKPEPLRVVRPSPNKELTNPLLNSVVALAVETAEAGYGALVFCSSRIGCETDAALISRALYHRCNCDHLILEKRSELLADLRSTSAGLDPVLEKTIPTGVAFHHAGLTTEERELVATAYDQGLIKVLVATCSLAAGINLPARRVILHGARMGPDFVGPSLLRQMKGRAGRKGKDEVGETYLCCQKSDLEDVAELIEADIPNIESCLVPSKRGIKRALLEVLSTRLADSDESIGEYMKNTLLYHSLDEDSLSNMVTATMQELQEEGLVLKIDEVQYATTRLGQAIVGSSLAPNDGLFVHGELRKALQAFVLDGEMHVLYIFTPIQASQGKINWQKFRAEMESLDESNLRVLDFVGLKPSIINKMAQGGTMGESTPEEIELARIYKRFYTALQLRDLCNEIPVHTVARKYDIPRGNVQNLAQTCHGFAAGMVKFCQIMEWGALSAVLDHFSDRLKAGAKADLLTLAKVKFIKSRTARLFYDNGFKSVAALAAADVNDILPILIMAQPRKPRTTAEREEHYIAKLKSRAEIISLSAAKIWEEEVRRELDEAEEE